MLTLYCTDGEVQSEVPLEELGLCYTWFEEVKEQYVLPFSCDLVRTWLVLHTERAFYLRSEVEEVLKWLGLKGIPVQVMPWQQEAHERAYNSLMTHGVYEEVSPLGAGKTYNGSALIQRVGAAHVVTVCPANIEPVWEDQRCAIPHLRIESYNRIRGVKKPVTYELKHGLLIRHDKVEVASSKKGPVEIEVAEFTPSPTLLRMCEEGLFLICDEVQGLQNASVQQKAVRAIIKAMKGHPRCYIGFLSGSPFDKESGALRMMQTLGLVQSDTLLKMVKKPKQVIQVGTKEAILSCEAMERKERARLGLRPERGTSALQRTVDAPVTGRLSVVLPQTQEDAMKLVYDLYMSVVVPSIVVCSDRPNIPYKHEIINAFYTFDEEDALRYYIQMADMRSDMTELDNGNVLCDFTTIGRCLRLMEYSSVKSIVEDMTRVRQLYPHDRCLVFLTYKDSYDRALDLMTPAMADDTQVVNGDIRPAARATMFEQFQNGEKRTMLLGVGVGGAGLSLPDRRGDMTTHVWIVSGYSCIAGYQASGRVYRPGTMSNCFTKFVWCRQHPALHLLGTLQLKSKHVRKAVAEQNIALPDSYKNFKIPERLPMLVPSK